MDRVRGGRQKYKRRLEAGPGFYAKAPYGVAVGSSEFTPEAPPPQTPPPLPSFYSSLVF